MGAGPAKATGPREQKTAPSVGWGGSFRVNRPSGDLALRRFGRSGRRSLVRRRLLGFLGRHVLLVLRLHGLRRRHVVGGGRGGGGRSRRVSLGDRGKRRENDRGADPDSGQCLHHSTFSVLFDSWPLAGEAMRPF